MLNRKLVKQMEVGAMSLCLAFSGAVISGSIGQNVSVVKAGVTAQGEVSEAEDASVTYESYEKEYKLKNGTVYLSITTKCPYINGEGEVYEKMNKTMEDYVASIIAEAKTQKAEAKEFKKLYKDVVGYTSFSLDAEVMYQKDGIISVLFSGYDYPIGAAHGSPYRQTFTFDTETGEVLSMEELLGKTTAEVRKLLNKKVKKLIQKEPEGFYENALSIAKQIMKENPGNFYVTEKGLVYYFNAYDIAPYAAGMPEVIVSLPKN